MLVLIFVVFVSYCIQKPVSQGLSIKKEINVISSRAMVVSVSASSKKKGPWHGPRPCAFELVELIVTSYICYIFHSLVCLEVPHCGIQRLFF